MLKYILALILTMTSAPVLAQGTPRTGAGASTGSPTMSPGQRIQADPRGPLQPQVSLDDVKRLPIVRMLLDGGGELYYLGERSGLMGFFLYKAEQVQTLYLTADMQSVLVGGVYSPDGANVSSQQISEASNQNSQLAGLLMAAAEKQKEFEATSGLSKEVAEPESKSAMPKAAPLSPGERLHHDFLVTAGVIVGEADKPLLLMLVDPLCEHCRKTWKLLKPSVMSGALRIKLIPIGPENSERERMAAKFLNVKEPLKVWNKIEEDDYTVVEGTPTATELAHVRATMAMAQSWKINATPYLVYRGKDKKVKVVQGEPEKIDAVLADLIP
ncbi:MAG: hypothetical protein WBK91_10325 [Alphaproteobacteria bacterium]